MKCEEKLKDVRKITLNETSLQDDIRNLMDSYNNWGELLDAAPLAIGILGKLIVMSHQKMSFHSFFIPFPSSRSFFISPKKFTYPKSFRNSLLQITRKGNLVFLKAHDLIKRIQVYNSNLSMSSPIKDLSRLLVSRSEFSKFTSNYWSSLKGMYWSSLKGNFESLPLHRSKTPSAEVVKEFQMVLGLIEEMIVTAKQLELRRRNRQQVVMDKVVERNESFEINNIYNMEAIKALQNALNDLTVLKSAWMKLIEFYNKMSVLMSKSTVESKEFVDALQKNNGQLEDEKIFTTLMGKVQMANETAFLVHEVSHMYVDISEMYIVDQMAHLDQMMNATEVDMDKLQLELTWSAESDAEGIRHFIKADETLLRDKLADRYNQIVNEYRWMQDCDSEEDP